MHQSRRSPSVSVIQSRAQPSYTRAELGRKVFACARKMQALTNATMATTNSTIELTLRHLCAGLNVVPSGRALHRLPLLAAVLLFPSPRGSPASWATRVLEKRDQLNLTSSHPSAPRPFDRMHRKTHNGRAAARRAGQSRCQGP
jgi:hypothetical protein